MSVTVSTNEIGSELVHDLVCEPFANSLAVFKTDEGCYCLSFRESSKIINFTNEEDAYKMLKSVLVHFGELNDGKDITVPVGLEDVDVYSIDMLEENQIIVIFEECFGMHWTDVTSMKFKKNDYRKEKCKDHTTD